MRNLQNITKEQVLDYVNKQGNVVCADNCNGLIEGKSAAEIAEMASAMNFDGVFAMSNIDELDDAFQSNPSVDGVARFSKSDTENGDQIMEIVLDKLAVDAGENAQIIEDKDMYCVVDGENRGYYEKQEWNLQDLLDSMNNNA